RVHVAELVVRGDRAAAGADRNERAVVALLPRGETLEVAQRRGAQVVPPVVDVARGLERFAGEAGTREERSVGTDRVGVRAVYLARPHVNAIGGGEPALLRLLAKKRHLLVHEVARVADAADAGAGRRHARAVQGLAVGADGGQRDQPLGEGGLL